MERWRKACLTMGLTLSYLLVVTPAAWLLRCRRKEALPLTLNGRAAVKSYWASARVDSDDCRVYQEYPRLLGGLTFLKRFILLSILPWKTLASQPPEKALRSDLYVMF